MKLHRVFISFSPSDLWRANIVRNSGAAESVALAGFRAKDQWDTALAGSDTAIKGSIDRLLQDTSVTIVLIGADTSRRSHIDYEIERSIKQGNAILGIRVHQLKDANGATAPAGPIPDALTRIDAPVYTWEYGRLREWIDQAVQAAELKREVKADRHVLMSGAIHTLIIRHVDQHRFVVTRPEDGQSSAPVTLTAPDAIAVEGRPNSNLLQDLRWYLQQFLSLPVEPFTDVANRVQRALADWGRSTFAQLFQGRALQWYDHIHNGGLDRLVLKIASDDPRILAWPWEVLCDSDGATLGHGCRFERQLPSLPDPPPLPSGLPRSQVNILLVIARPYGDHDVGFQAVSGPLVEWIHRERVAVQIDLLRPPTVAALERRLASQPEHYHIVHYDGHGDHAETLAQGQLIFESESGHPDPVSALRLAAILTEHRIPIVVLNACHSARVDGRATDPFASTADALLKAGIRSVVAMGYNLYVSGARQFVPAFYRRLLQTGDIAAATRDGRKAMLKQDRRIGPLCEHPLQDWLVPVLYQQATVPLCVEPGAAIDTRLPELPEEARDLGHYGFIGRQDAIQQLERALLHQPAAAVLIHGMAGIGKTILVKGFLRWLQQTDGIRRENSRAANSALFADALWFSFDVIQSAECVIDRLLQASVGNEATALPMDQKLPLLVRALRELPLLVVWDNFETVMSIDGTEMAELIAAADHTLLQRLLKELHGGRTKILITSQSPEPWLSPVETFRLPLSGLRGEDLWVYCNAVVRDLGLTLDPTDEDCVELLDELDGHPLALRTVLLQLNEISVREALDRVRRQVAINADNPSTQRIFAALALLEDRLPPSFSPVLELIGLHQRYVQIDHMAAMLAVTDDSTERRRLDDCFVTLERGGLIHHLGKGVYSMHPALHAFLARSHPAGIARIENFVGFMASFASHLATKHFYDQREPMALHAANLQYASMFSRSLDDAEASYWLTLALATFALNSRDFASATHLFQTLILGQALNHPEREASAFHQLGRIAQEQRDYEAAERWYRASLAISERHGNEHEAASTYHQLGILAQRTT